MQKRDLWTTLILVLWCIWRHRNDIVFNGAVASQVAIKEKINEEYESWRQAKLFHGTGFGFPDPSVTMW
jgi:hypothetical protein